MMLPQSSKQASDEVSHNPLDAERFMCRHRYRLSVDIELIDIFANQCLDLETRIESGNIFLQYYSNSINDPEFLYQVFEKYIFDTLIDTNEQIASLSEQVSLVKCVCFVHFSNFQKFLIIFIFLPFAKNRFSTP